MHKLFVPKQAVGANLIYFDFWNASQSNINVCSVVPVISGAAAVTGVLGVDLFLQRTTAVGTGGTAATYEGTDPTACTISAYDNSQPHNSSIVTARLTPTGGATSGAVLSFRSVFTEETAAAPYDQLDMVGGGQGYFACICLMPGSGLKVVQGAVASVGNIGFDLLYQRA